MGWMVLDDVLMFQKFQTPLESLSDGAKFDGCSMAMGGRYL